MTGMRAKQGDSLSQICACGHHFGVHDPLGRCDASVEVARDTYARCQCRQFTADSPSRTKQAEMFPARVGREGRAVHDASRFRVGSRTWMRTACGYTGHEGWIVRCDLEPVTCRICLKKRTV